MLQINLHSNRMFMKTSVISSSGAVEIEKFVSLRGNDTLILLVEGEVTVPR